MPSGSPIIAEPSVSKIRSLPGTSQQRETPGGGTSALSGHQSHGSNWPRAPAEAEMNVLRGRRRDAGGPASDQGWSDCRVRRAADLTAGIVAVGADLAGAAGVGARRGAAIGLRLFSSEQAGRGDIAGVRGAVGDGLLDRGQRVADGGEERQVRAGVAARAGTVAVGPPRAAAL